MRAGTIAIVGGGPAGSFLATELSRAGRDVFLFDEKMAWEKPCGGGLTDKALTRWPFLREAPVARNFIKNFELIAPSGRRVSFSLDRQIAIFSRLALNGFLLERARSAGARLIRERVIEIGGKPGQWIVTTKHGCSEADFVVVATGARNSFREQFSSALNGDNFLIALGYYIPGTHQTVHVKFIDGLHGYVWVFPRCDHFSVGICARMRDGSTAHLRELLESCLPEFGLALDGAQFYAHVIPSLTMNTLRSRRFCGQGWAMVGDAAGFVDAITGEGIFYSLQSAELLAHALLSNAPEKYRDLLQRELLPELEEASSITNHFYSGEWMGGPVIERMVQLTRRSPRFRDLMRDLCAGGQDYSTLKQRLYRSLPKIVAEALVNRVWHGTEERELAIAS